MNYRENGEIELNNRSNRIQISSRINRKAGNRQPPMRKQHTYILTKLCSHYSRKYFSGFTSQSCPQDVPVIRTC